MIKENITMTDSSYPHCSSNWSVYLPQLLHIILRDDLKVHPSIGFHRDDVIDEAVKLIKEQFPDVKTISDWNGKCILRRSVVEIANRLLVKHDRRIKEQMREIEDRRRESILYQMKSSHAWALKSYEYLMRRIEDNIQCAYPEAPTHKDMIIIGDFKAVMIVPRLIFTKELAG